MKAKYTTWYYPPLKFYVIVTCFLFFRKLRMKGLKNIPRKSPVIFAANHQNALLDPLVIHATSFKQPYFLTRGDIFNNKFLDKFLRGIKMLPIYRIRDGYDSIKMNEAVFEAASDILLSGGAVGIFPEGSHSLKYQIRPVKKGLARIAFRAEEAADFNLNLKIVPVGIYYEKPLSTKGRTLTTYGEPIKVSDFEEVFRKNQNEGIEALMSKVKESIKPLMLHFDNKEKYEQNLKTFTEKRIYKRSINKQLDVDQALVNSIEKGMAFDIKPDKRSIFFYLGHAWLILWGIVSFIPRAIVDLIIKKKVKDPHFYATMRYGYSIILYPIFFLILYFLIRYLVF